MLKPDFRPSQLPEFSPPLQAPTTLKRAVAQLALVALAALAGLIYVLLTSAITRLALAPAIAIGVLLSMHLGVVLIARLRQGDWLGLTGLLITVLATLAATAVTGISEPTDHAAPAGGYVPLNPPSTDHWMVRSARDMADNAASLVVIIGALISSWIAVRNARPR